MKKFFLAGLLGLGSMVGMGVPAASAAVWHSGHYSHVVSRPIVRHEPVVRREFFTRPYAFNHYYGYGRYADRYYETPVYTAPVYDRCW